MTRYLGISPVEMATRLARAEREIESMRQMVRNLLQEGKPNFSLAGKGDRVEGFYLNAQLDARAGCDGYGAAVSATILDDDGELTSETIELGDIIMSPGDFLAAGSKGWMRLRNGEWKVIVPYCKTSGENTPPPNTTPDPGDPNQNLPASYRYSNYQQEVAMIMSSSSAFAGDMTNDGDELP